MHRPSNLVYRCLRIVESFGVEGCTAADFSAKRYGQRRNSATAGRILGQLARAGYVIAVEDGTGRPWVRKDVVHHLADAGRQYLASAHASARDEANARAEARSQATDTYYGQGMAYGGGNR
jgi:hypothetical protein